MPPETGREHAAGLRAAVARAVECPRLGHERGGPSRYGTLNLATHVGDDAATVAANRGRLRAALGLPAEPRWLEQVHGTRVLDLDREDARAGRRCGHDPCREGVRRHDGGLPAGACSAIATAAHRCRARGLARPLGGVLAGGRRRVRHRAVPARGLARTCDRPGCVRGRGRGPRRVRRARARPRRGGSRRTPGAGGRRTSPGSRATRCWPPGCAPCMVGISVPSPSADRVSRTGARPLAGAWLRSIWLDPRG